MKIAEKLKALLRKWLYPKATGELVFVENSSPVIGVNEILANPIVRAAINRIVQSTSSVPLVVYRGDVEVSEEDPAAHLAENIALGQSNPQFVAAVTNDLLIYGNSYWRIAKVGKRILGLVYMHPTSISRSIDKNELYFHDEKETVTLKAGEFVHFKMLNPIDPQVEGLPLLYSIYNPVVLVNEMDRLLSEFLYHGAQPLAILFTKQMMTETIYNKLTERLQARVGRGQRYRWLVLDGTDFEVKTIDTAFKAGDLVNMRKILREEILACLNVPPAIVGIYEYANYANAREQTKIFWRETIIPILRLIEETLNTQFFAPHLGVEYWCAFDISQVEAIHENLADSANAISNLVNNGIITINEARELLGFGDKVSWGDDWWGSVNIVPIATNKPTQQKSNEPHIVVSKRIPQEYIRMWKQFLKIHSKHEGRVVEAVRDYATDLERRLKERLRTIHRKDLMDMLFNPEEEAEVLEEALLPVLEEILREAPTEFGVAVDNVLYDPKVGAALRKFKRRIRWITETTWEALREALADALAEGGGWNALIEAVEKIIGQLETWRAERIARTETTAALNVGYLESLKLVGATKKMWLTAGDERVRDAHEAMDGIIVNIDEPFVLPSGAVLNFPCDPDGDPHETINCRCTIVPVD